MMKWINDSKEHWNGHKLKDSRKAIIVLADIMEHGCVTSSLSAKIERTPPYAELPNWSRTILDNYLAMLKGAYRKSYLTLIRNACSRFFMFLEFAEINQPSKITHKIVKSFFIQDIHSSSKIKDVYDEKINHCFRFFAIFIICCCNSIQTTREIKYLIDIFGKYTLAVTLSTAKSLKFKDSSLRSE